MTPALAPMVANQWQPIETCPADTTVIVWCHWVDKVRMGRYATRTTNGSKTGWRVNFDCSSAAIVIWGDGPKWWMPLPDAPMEPHEVMPRVPYPHVLCAPSTAAQE